MYFLQKRRVAYLLSINRIIVHIHFNGIIALLPSIFMQWQWTFPFLRLQKTQLKASSVSTIDVTRQPWLTSHLNAVLLKIAPARPTEDIYSQSNRISNTELSSTLRQRTGNSGVHKNKIEFSSRSAGRGDKSIVSPAKQSIPPSH